MIMVDFEIYDELVKGLIVDPEALRNFECNITYIVLVADHKTFNRN